MANRLVSVDENYIFPTPLEARLAALFSDKEETESALQAIHESIDPSTRINEVWDPLPAGASLWRSVSPDIIRNVNDSDLGPAIELVQTTNTDVMSVEPIGSGDGGRFALTSGQRIAATCKVKAVSACRVFLRILSIDVNGASGSYLGAESKELAAGDSAILSAEGIGDASTATARAYIQVFASGTTTSPAVGTTIRTSQWTVETDSNTPLPLPFLIGGQKDVRWESAPNSSRSILDHSILGSAIESGRLLSPIPKTVVTVPSSYSTLQRAIDAFETRHINRGSVIEIRMESGYTPANGIKVSDGDFSMFRITSVDPVVEVAQGFDGDFIQAQRAQAPTLACLVDMKNSGADGYHLIGNSTGLVEQYKGVRNAGSRGLYISDNSSCFALRSEFTGSNDRNVWVSRASNLDAELANFSANKGGDNAVYISRSSIANLEDCTITDAFKNALTVTRSWVTATGANLSRASEIGLICYGRVNAGDIVINDCGLHGAYVEQGSSASLLRSTITGNGGDGIRSQTGSTVAATSATVSGNADKDLFAYRGSFIEAGEVTTTSSAVAGVPNVTDTNMAEFNKLTRDGVIWSVV